MRIIGNDNNKTAMRYHPYLPEWPLSTRQAVTSVGEVVVNREPSLTAVGK